MITREFNMEKRHISSEFRLALALAIVKGRGRSKVAEQDAHWKKKARLYKQEIKALRQEVQEMDDHATLEKLPALAPCDCLFLSGGLWRLQKTEIDNTSVGDKNTNKLSVELFLSNVRRLMRAKQKKRAGSSTVIIPRGMQVSLEENLKGHIALSLQFIMDLFSEAQTSSKTKQFSAYIHQSVKFIKECIIQLIDKGAEDKYSVQEMVKKFTSSLSIKIMNHISDEGPDARVWIQQTSYQLGSLPCFGHQLLFIISKLIAEVIETLVCLNPFHEGAAQTYENLYFLYQLFEKIVADYLCEWANTGDLDIEVLTNTFERHFSTVRHLMKFPNWGSLIVQYNTKLTGEIVAQLSTAVCINHYAEESQQTALLNLLELAKHATTDVT